MMGPMDRAVLHVALAAEVEFNANLAGVPETTQSLCEEAEVSLCVNSAARMIWTFALTPIQLEHITAGMRRAFLFLSAIPGV